jgi:hypothetical protein
MPRLTGCSISGLNRANITADNSTSSPLNNSKGISLKTIKKQSSYKAVKISYLAGFDLYFSSL